MKNLILILLTAFTLSCCNKDDDNPIAEIDKLPPATQTGANTAGCLVNGIAFLPKGNFPGINPLLYQDGVNFVLFIGEEKDGKIKSLGVFSGNQHLEVETIYNLGQNNNDGNSKYGIYSIDAVTPPNLNYYTTTNIYNGELKITHHDFSNRILSGTFWFDAVNSSGENIKVREGRFDRHY